MSKTLIGIVASDKSDKTISVRVAIDKVHPLYKKRYAASKKYLVHDEKNEAKVGDKVSIIETRPFSARKRFALQSVVEKAVITHKEEEPQV
jgi:small subunit ribosomal protein S17